MNNTIDFISADRRGLFRTLLLLGVHFRTVRAYPRSSAANKKSPRSSAANKKSPRKSAANKKSPRKSAAKIEVLASLLLFLCIIPINAQQHTYSIDQLKKHNGKASRFNYSLPGKVKRGCYIIHGNHNKKKYADQFVSMEIIQLDDQELTLYRCVLP